MSTPVKVIRFSKTDLEKILISSEKNLDGAEAVIRKKWAEKLLASDLAKKHIALTAEIIKRKDMKRTINAILRKYEIDTALTKESTVYKATLNGVKKLDTMLEALASAKDKLEAEMKKYVEKQYAQSGKVNIQEYLEAPKLMQQELDALHAKNLQETVASAIKENSNSFI